MSSFFVELARLSPDLREDILAVAREGTLVGARDRRIPSALGVTSLGAVIVLAVAFVIARPPFDEGRVHGALAAGAALGLLAAGVGLGCLGLGASIRRFRAPLGPCLATVPGLGLASWGDGRVLVFGGASLATPPRVGESAGTWRRLPIDVAGGARELRVRGGSSLEKALGELALAPESVALDLVPRLEREGARARVPWPPRARRAGRTLALPALAVFAMGSLAFATWERAGERRLDALVRRLEDETRADVARVASGARPALASLSAVTPDGEDAAPLYLALVRELIALETPEHDHYDLEVTPGEPQARPELERRRALVERALRAAAAPRCDLRPHADEALALSRESLETVPLLLGAAAHDMVLRGGRPLEGATLALASLRAAADLEPLGIANTRRPALAALDLAASQGLSPDEYLSPEATESIERLANDLAAIEASFPDAPTELERSTRALARRIARSAKAARGPRDVLTDVGLTPYDVNVGLWRWFPTAEWLATGLETLLARGERAATTAREPDPVIRIQQSRDERRAESSRPLVEALDPLGRRGPLWDRAAPAARATAEDDLARLRLARAAALVVLGSRFVVEAKGELPADPLVPGKSVRLEGYTRGFAVVAGLAKEDAGEGHPERGTTLRGGVLESDGAYAGTGEIALLCELPRVRTSVVEAGLTWLLRHQRESGEFAAASTCPDHGGRPASKNLDTSVRATALGTLALLGAGYTPQNRSRFYDHRELRVWSHGAGCKAALLLLERVATEEPSAAIPLDEQALVSLALTETYALTNATRLRAPAEAAITRLAARVARREGRGAAARERESAAWVALALSSARAARIAVPAAALDAARSWAADLEKAAPEAPLALVPATILAVSDGIATDEARARRERILAALEKDETPCAEVVALEVAALSLETHGPDFRETAKRLRALRDTLARRQAQARDGCLDGSFPPSAGPDRGTETATSLLAVEHAYGYASTVRARHAAR